MGTAIDAVFENGMLRPLSDPGLKDNERVRIVILPRRRSVRETSGVLGPLPEDVLRYLAEDDDVLQEDE